MSLADVRVALDDAVDTQPFSFVPAPTNKPFRGVIKDDTFQIYRRIGYRNSWRPTIKGHVTTATDGSEINLDIGVHWFVLGFTLFWLGSLGLMLVGMLSRVVSGQVTENATSSLALMVLMFCFGLALSWGAYSFEANKAKVVLRAIFRVRAE